MKRFETTVVVIFVNETLTVKSFNNLRLPRLQWLAFLSNHYFRFGFGGITKQKCNSSNYHKLITKQTKHTEGVSQEFSHRLPDESPPAVCQKQYRCEAASTFNSDQPQTWLVSTKKASSHKDLRYLYADIFVHTSSAVLFVVYISCKIAVFLCISGLTTFS